MRLGIGELKLRKKGLLPEMQLLAEMHFQTKVILLQTPCTLVPSTTKKTAVSVSLSPQSRRWMRFNNLIPSIDRGNTHKVNAWIWLALAICALHVTNCQTNNHGNVCWVTGPIATAKRKQKPGVSKHGYFSAGYVHLPLRSVYSKTVLYSALRSLLSPVFCVF